MERIKLNESNYRETLKRAIAVLRQGGLVVYPTETCYGVGVDATNQKAVGGLLQYKPKQKHRPISIAVSGKAMAAKYVHINKVASNVYDNFLPGPITVVSKGKQKLAVGVESSRGTQGVRVPDYKFVLDLLKAYKKPITATSANARYKKVPYTVADVLQNLSGKQKQLIDLIVDAGRLPKRKPSTVVDTTLDSVHIVREGSIVLHNPIVFKSHSLDDTRTFARRMHTELKKYWGKKEVVVLLQGDLGAGKTHLTKYLAEKLGVKEVVNSPTFNLCNEYTGRIDRKKIKVYHLDTYRMYDPRELEELAPKDIFKAPNVVVIEWANKIYSYVQQYLKGAVVVEVIISAPTEFERIFEYNIRR
jgi:L-threonylcarbamoyladenylate synthase